LFEPLLEEARPLSLFDGLRVDFSLARLRHYTGTPPEDVQQYVLLTNYHRYVDEFVRWAVAELKAGGPYTALSCVGGVTVTADTPDPELAVAAGRLAQASDARVPPHGAGAERDHPGQHRGGAVQRQDDHRTTSRC
jgi:hypothetical protein